MLVWVIYYLSVFSPLLPIIAGLRRRKRLLWYYAVAGFLFDMLYIVFTTVCSSAYPHPVVPIVQNLFLAGEFLLVSFYYRQRILRSRYFDYFIIPASLALFLISTMRQGIALNFIGGTLFDFICIFYAVCGFYALLKRPPQALLENSGFFWVNVAFLIYCSANFIIFLCTEYLVQNNRALSVKIWAFHNVMNILFSILIAISFLKKDEGRWTRAHRS